MRLSIALFCKLLFATTIFAAPSHFADAGHHVSVPANSIASTHRVEQHPVYKRQGLEELSTAWAGAVITPPPTGLTFYAVLGTFVVPLPSPSESGPGEWGGGAWVGLKDIESIVQAGACWMLTVDDSGDYTYVFSLWYEWYPANTVYLDMAVGPGDLIDIWCEVTSTTTAFCIINNISTDVENIYEFVAPSGYSITPNEVDWIMEGHATFANFGAITFTNCIAVAGTDFQAVEDLYPNATSADYTNIAVNTSTDITITTVHFPPASNQAVEINYIGPPR